MVGADLQGELNQLSSFCVSKVRGSKASADVSTKIQPFSLPEGMHAIKIRADAKFWRHWRGNSEQMQQIGYRCRKVGRRWHAWLLVRDEEKQTDLFGKAA